MKNHATFQVSAAPPWAAWTFESTLMTKIASRAFLRSGYLDGW